MCIGNWQQKNKQATSPPSLPTIFEAKWPKAAELFNAAKTLRSNSKCALEDLHAKAHLILKGPLTAEHTEFLAALFSFHPNKRQGKIEIGTAFGQPAFVVGGEPISIKKCLIGLQEVYIKSCDEFAVTYVRDTQVGKMISLLNKIAQKYPFS